MDTNDDEPTTVPMVMVPYVVAHPTVILGDPGDPDRVYVVVSADSGGGIQIVGTVEQVEDFTARIVAAAKAQAQNPKAA